MAFAKKALALALLCSVVAALVVSVCENRRLRQDFESFVENDAAIKNNIVRLLETNYAQQRSLTHVVVNSSMIVEATERAKGHNRGRVEPYKGRRHTKPLAPQTGMGGY